MRLPLTASTYAMPVGGIEAVANSLQKQILDNISAGAKAQYANQLMRGQANTATGQGQNALAQGRFAPQMQQGLAQQSQAEGNLLQAQVPFASSLAQGIANQAQGTGKTLQATGNLAVPTAAATLENTQLQPGLTSSTTALQNAENTSVTNTAVQIGPNAAATRYGQLIHAYMQANPHATIAQIQTLMRLNHPVLFNAINSNATAASPPGTAAPSSGLSPDPSPTEVPNSGQISLKGNGQYQYTTTNIIQGNRWYWVPSLNKWIR